MQSRFMLSVSWVLASFIGLSSCTSGGGSSGSSGGSSGQPVIDASGKKIYTVDPATGAILSASGITSSDPSFANAAVVIPPGALSIPVDISMFQAQSLASSSAASAVGSSNLTAAGPAVAILPSQAVSIANPLAISIPFSALTSLTGDKQLVVIAIYPGESKNELETFVGSELDLGTSGVVKLSVTKFGAFQAVYSDSVVEKKKVETNVVISQVNSASLVNPYADYVSSWWQGCFPDGDEFRSETVKISVDNSGNGMVEANASQYADQNCQFLLFKEERVERLRFSSAVIKGSKINVIEGTVETLKFMVPSTNSSGHYVCGMSIGGYQGGTFPNGSPDVWQEVKKSDCVNSDDDKFSAFKVLSKIEGNMLFVKGCQEGSDCVASAPSLEWGPYMTRVEAARPNFMLRGPKFFSDDYCHKFSLQSDQDLTQLMTVKISGSNFSMYSSEDCSSTQNPMSDTQSIASISTELLVFYVKATDVTSDVNIDIRVADSTSKIGLVNRIAKVPSYPNYNYESGNGGE